MQDNLKHCAYSRSSAVSRYADERHSASRAAFPNESRGPPQLDGRCPSEPNGRCPPNWAAAVLPNRVANSRRPWGIARVVCGPLAPTGRPESPTSNSRISPDGAFEPSQTALLGQPKPAPSGQPRPGPSGEPVPSLLSLRPRLTLACPSALVPVKATPTKPPARFPRGL